MQKAASLTAPALTSSGSSTVSTETQTHGPDLLPYRNRSLQIPVEVDLKSIISPPPPGEGDNDPRDVAAKRERLASSLITRHENLLKAINELVSLGPNNLRAPIANPHPGVVVDKQTPYKLFVDQLDFQTTLKDINVAQFKAAADRGGTGQPDPLKLQDLGGANSALALSRDLLTVPRGVTPLGPWKPQIPSEFAMVIGQSVVLSDTTQAILKDKNIDVQMTPVNGKHISLPMMYQMYQIFNDLRVFFQRLSDFYERTIPTRSRPWRDLHLISRRSPSNVLVEGLSRFEHRSHLSPPVFCSVTISASSIMHCQYWQILGGSLLPKEKPR